MTTIRQEDLIESVADALQYICYYHPADYIARLGARLRARAESPAAKDAIAQILTNSRMCAEGHRPICQDTGIVIVFLKVGMDVRWDGCDDAASRTWSTKACAAPTSIPDNKLRASIVADPQFARKNTKDNTPAVIHMRARARRQGRRARSRPRAAARENKSEVRRCSTRRDSHRRLGAEDGADDGRRLVPAGHARHRHRRHRREGDAAGQGSADGADRHARAARRAARRTRSRSCASSSTTRSTRSASARRAWAA